MDEVINYIEKNNSEDFKKESKSLETFRFDIDLRGLSEKIEKELEMINIFEKFKLKGKVNIKNVQRIKKSDHRHIFRIPNPYPPKIKFF